MCRWTRNSQANYCTWSRKNKEIMSRQFGKGRWNVEVTFGIMIFVLFYAVFVFVFIIVTTMCLLFICVFFLIWDYRCRQSIKTQYPIWYRQHCVTAIMSAMPCLAFHRSICFSLISIRRNTYGRASAKTALSLTRETKGWRRWCRLIEEASVIIMMYFVAISNPFSEYALYIHINGQDKQLKLHYIQ